MQQVNNFDNSDIPAASAFNVQNEVIFDYSPSSNTTAWPNQFIDYEFDLTHQNSAIYAVISEDAHGLTSGYSVQIFVAYDKINNKYVKSTISRPGAPQPYPNIFLEQDFFIDVIKQSNYNRCNIFFDPEYYKLFRTEPTDSTIE